MSYQLNENDIFGFASSRCIETHQKGDELVFKWCPYCGGDGRDKDTFAINLKKGVFNCFRASCDKHGHFVELCRDFDYPLEFDTPTIYRELPQPKTPVPMRDSSLAYLAKRGISREIAERYEITTRKEQQNIMCFPFYDENEKLVTIKYRNMNYQKGRDRNKEWFEKDTRPILFGMKQCDKTFDQLIITEGQIDALSVAEAGFRNVVSVPNGCSSFTWVTPCSEWVNKFKKVIVFGDWERGKMTLLDTLKDRLDCCVLAVRRQDYLGEKDANDILTKYGTQAIRTAIERAEEPKINNVKDLSTVKPVDLNTLEKVKTGIRDIDRDAAGLVMGELVILTGERGQGKSTFLSQILCNVLNQKDPDGNPYCAFVYSGELQDQFFKRWIDFQLAGPENIEEIRNEYGDKEYTLAIEIVDRISEWYKGRMYIYDNSFVPDDDQNMTDLLLDTIEKVIKQYNTRVIAIDNLMTALESITNQNDLYIGQSQFVGKLKRLAMKYNVCIIVVAHPRKAMYGIKKSRELDNDDVSGSGDVTNKADLVLSCSRDRETNGINYIQITKNRLLGRHRMGENKIKLLYSEKSRRMYANPEAGEIRYGWDTMSNFRDDNGEQIGMGEELPW